MKKSLSTQIFSFIVLAIFLVNCSSEESSLNITSIKINAESTVLLSQTMTITAENQDGIDITDQVTFRIGNIKLEGNTHTPESVGTFTIGATYENISSSFEFTVIENISSLVLSADNTSIKPNNSVKVQFTVVNQIGEDVTAAVDLYKDGELYNSDVFFTSEFGTFEFTAKYKDIVSNALSIVSELNVTSLILSSDKEVIPANGNTSPIFYIRDQDLDTITSFAKVFYNGAELTDNKFTTSDLGSYDFVAKYENLESNTLTITSEPQRSNRKVLVEEFTGEWCGWCPQAAYNLDLLVKNNDKVLTVGIHNGDDFEYVNEAIIRNAFGLSYFPSGLVGRVNLGRSVGYNDVQLSSVVTDEIDRQLNNEEVLAGLSINTSVNGNNALVDVDVYFYNNIQEKVAATIYLIENDVVGNVQQNYFANYAPYEGTYYYSQPGAIVDYVHQYLLRRVATNVYGDDIPSEDTKRNKTYKLSQKTIDITNFDASKCFIIAFVHYDLRGENQTIINAQQVQLGSSIGYEQ